MEAIPAIELTFRDYAREEGELHAELRIAITVPELAERIRQAAAPDVAAAFAANLRFHPAAARKLAAGNHQHTSLTVTLTDGDPTVKIESTVERHAEQVAAEVRAQTTGPALENLAALIDPARPGPARSSLGHDGGQTARTARSQ